jgi:hypothetical protein
MKYLESLAIAGLAIFAPIKAVILVVGVLILADLIVGLLAAHKRGEPISSAGLRRTVTKAFVYEAAVMLGFLTETYLTGDSIPITKIVSGFIGVVELKSILESLDTLNGSPLYASLISKLGSQNDTK